MCLVEPIAYTSLFAAVVVISPELYRMFYHGTDSST
jgi:hypothetical protein